MAVFRVEKTKDYTVMANHHLKNRCLSLKAKGLLSVMLSLPDTWDFTLKGLSRINREGVDAIREAVRELERAGYIVRTRARNEQGQLKGCEYVIYEISHESAPAQENPTQFNTNQFNTYSSNTQSIHPYPSIREERDEMDEIERTRRAVMEQIEYEAIVQPHNRAMLDEMVEILTETLCSRKEQIAVNGEQMPAEYVKERLRRLTSAHIDYVFDALRQKRTHVRHVRQYMLTTLFNAPVTIEQYYEAQARHQHLI